MSLETFHGYQIDRSPIKNPRAESAIKSRENYRPSPGIIRKYVDGYDFQHSLILLETFSEQNCQPEILKHKISNGQHKMRMRQFLFVTWYLS